MEAQDGEGKPWYTGNDDTPEGIFELLQEFPECDWANDGNVSDVSVASSEDAEEDAEQRVKPAAVVLYRNRMCVSVLC